MPKIIILNNSNLVIDGNKVFVNFDKIKNDSIRLEMEIKDYPNTAKAIWVIQSNGELLDLGDLTTGIKAELIILKSYSGSHENPHIFTITTKDESGKSIASLELIIFAHPQVTNARWWDADEEKEAYEVGINTNCTTFIECVGLFGHSIKIDVYFKRPDGNEQKIFEHIATIDNLYSMKGFYLGQNEFLKNKSFYLHLIPYILTNLGLTTLNITAKIKHTSLGKLYFIISYDNKLLFHGDEQKKYLDVYFELLLNEAPEENVTPVVVSTEKYFTQKYEPCKYEKVFYQYGKQKEIEIFDEKKPTTKDKDGKFNNSKLLVSAIAPPKGSKNIQELRIRLEKVDTKECQYNDNNKKYITFKDEDHKNSLQPHKGKVINTQVLQDAQIEVKVVKEDENVIILPSFNYQYDEKSPWEFLQNYFLITSMISSTDPTYSALKGVLINWEIQSKDLIQYYKIPIQTCRYKKPLYLKTYADVAWAFHAIYDDPYIPEYYNGNKNIKTIKGLSDEINWVKDNNIFDIFSAITVSPLIGPLIGDFIANIIEDMADRYELGFTAYYDFNDEGKNNEQIDYAETHPEVFKTLIAGILTLEILIDVALIVVTEGAALANFLSKAGKVAGAVNKGTKLAKTGKKAEDILKKHSDTFEKSRQMKTAKDFVFDMMKGSYYRGYRFIENGEIYPVIEERVKISPLLKLKATETKTLGQLLFDKTPQGMILNLAKSATGGFGLGVSRMFLKRIKYKKRDGKVVEIGKQGVSWYNAATYPLKIMNKTATTIYDLAVFATDEALKNVFGAEGEFEKRHNLTY